MPLPEVTHAVVIEARGDRLVAVADLPAGGVAEVRTEAHGVLAVGVADSRPFAVSNVCRHQFAKLGRGQVRDGCLECPWHRARYDPRTGEMVRGPQGRIFEDRADGGQRRLQAQDPPGGAPRRSDLAGVSAGRARAEGDPRPSDAARSRDYAASRSPSISRLSARRSSARRSTSRTRSAEMPSRRPVSVNGCGPSPPAMP